MGQQASLLLSDQFDFLTGTTASATVANNLTFVPDGVNPLGVRRWAEKTGDIPAGFPYITYAFRRPTAGNRNYKVTMTVVRPTLETLGTSSSSGYLPGQKVGYAVSARMEFVIPERSTIDERRKTFFTTASLFLTAINASDANPTVSPGSPLIPSIVSLEALW